MMSTTQDVISFMNIRDMNTLDLIQESKELLGNQES